MIAGLWRLFVLGWAVMGFIASCWLVIDVTRTTRRKVRTTPPAWRMSPQQRADVLIFHAVKGQHQKPKAHLQAGNRS